ncbi:hypothetical protein [Massilia horti]|uniref:Glycine zipper 2TM domain-containing protein n=1 Tax=Massilia horti TaxID=2562153 RepID=A0A4Y9T395_9BURK|nr:hypothetical protein [Massilia horti]TFW34494.1 hypothetical protein E4O92_03950 [Massilia horti]
MEIARSPNRIHPLMAAAAVSVIIVSLAGAAAITGILPTSHATTEAQQPPAAQAYGYAPVAAQPGMANQPQLAAPMAVPAGQMTAAYAQPVPAAAPQPQIIKEVVIKEVQKPAPKKVTHHTAQVAHYDAPRDYQPAPQVAQQPVPQPAPSQPNYIGIGTGAVIGGLIGNQVGGGNGKKLATVAGIIGGGMLGNEIANRNR